MDAANIDILEQLKQVKVESEFRPYVERSPAADAINVYFKGDRDYSKRLTDHVTLYLSLDSDEIVGCRIKGISALLKDLPNYIDVNHGGAKLSIIFLSFIGGVDEKVREALNTLAKLSKKAGDLQLEETT